MIINNYKNEKFIKWIVNYNCNYNCSYCFERDFHKKDISVNNIIETAYKVKSFVDKNNLTSIILLGGEFFLLDKKIIVLIISERHTSSSAGTPIAFFIFIKLLSAN